MNEVQKTAWYEKTGLLVILLIVFFPAGLYGVWKNSRFTTKTKGIITGVVAVVFIVVISSGGGGTKIGGGSSSETEGAAPQAAKSDKPKPGSYQTFDECFAAFTPHGYGVSAPLIMNPPLKADGQYYFIMGTLDGKDGKYYRGKLVWNEPRYFSFRLHKKVETPNFQINRPIRIVGKFIDVEKYRTVTGQERYMPVFEAVCALAQ
ncbi:MAG: hypothetical protein ABIM40_09825 [Pseudomonadota bacterium]